ncbi:trypsin-like serine protease [Vibrio owensii]|uniref:trypsin-like serine protease n=1 Tax=Vibrio owensii TaxID=696485 RepID=UPI003AAB6061
MESSPLLRTTGDAVESYVMSGDEVTARGWGQTESGPQSTLLKQATLVLSAGHSEPYLRNGDDSLPSRAVCPFGTDPLECSFDPLFTDQYSFKVTGSHVAPGDSGSPLFTSSNEVIGLLSTVRFIDRDPSKDAISADYVQYSAYNKFMLETVNDLVMPSHVIADAASGANYTFTLQNLSPANANIVLVDGEIEPGLTAATTCPATLAPNADCLVTLIVDGNQLGLAQGYEIEVKVSDSRSITLTTNSDSDSDEDKEEDDKDNDNGNEVTPTPDNGGSSGGSVGIFVLAMLGFVGLRRKF